MPGFAQENVGPLRWNQFQAVHNNNGINKSAKKTSTTLSLPFFEDFTGYSASPDSFKWQDCEVYINNTMGVMPVSRGVATFDDLNARGIPYDSFSNVGFRNADSLTSQPIDLSVDSAADSLYFSFFYQPQGNGFFPVIPDSLMLFFKNRYGDYVKVWAAPGRTLLPFQQVMIPITDTLYFHDNFQFRFINKAALYWADAVWNVDYIRLDKNRNIGDTTLLDVAFTSTPSFLLNDYTFMPYIQFRSNSAGELVSQVTDTIRNNTAFIESVNYSMIVTDLGSGATLATTPVSNVLINGYVNHQTIEPLSIPAYPAYPSNATVVFETKNILQTTVPFGPISNDTVVRNQVFDNYLAYDDGTAEKSYYLNLHPSLPGKIAIEYHLNRPDTLRGMAIYFGRQIPFANYKAFAIYVYSSIKINGATADVVIDSTDLLDPAYADSVNHFWYYTFNKPVLLPAGTFYAGTLQPRGGGSDSLYFGLDVNRVGPNHAYYNVLGTWTPSAISGAIMMRPLLGRYTSGSGLNNVETANNDWDFYPNPAQDQIRFRFQGDAHTTFQITDMQGRVLQTGTVNTQTHVDLSHLAQGIYLLNLASDGVWGNPKKLVKW